MIFSNLIIIESGQCMFLCPTCPPFDLLDFSLELGILLFLFIGVLAVEIPELEASLFNTDLRCATYFSRPVTLFSNSLVTLATASLTLASMILSWFFLK